MAGFAIPVGIVLAVICGAAAPWAMHLLYPGWSDPSAAIVYFLLACLAGILACGREVSYALGRVELPIAAHAVASIGALVGIWAVAALGLPLTGFALAWGAPYVLAWAWCCTSSGFVPKRPLPPPRDILADARLGWPFAAQMAGFVGLLSFDIAALSPGRGEVGTAYALYSKFSLIGGTLGMTMLAQYIRHFGNERPTGRASLIARLLLTWLAVAAFISLCAWLVGESLMHFLAQLPRGLFGPWEAGALFLLICARGAAETWAMVAAVGRDQKTARSVSLLSILAVLALFLVGRTVQLGLAGMLLLVATAWLIPALAGYVGYKRRPPTNFALA
jgi:hypothetical protein